MIETNEFDAVSEIAARLTDSKVNGLERLGGGRNSRVFRLETDAGIFALKQYPSREDDPRDRLGTESAALNWMNTSGVACVPRVIASDRNANFSLLSWVDGELVRSVAAEDIHQATRFLSELHRLRNKSPFSHERLAAEACLSGAEIERQLRERVSRLDAIEGEPDLKTFLKAEFSPALEGALTQSRQAFAQYSWPFDAELPRSYRSPVPSDFGFHNALKDAAGRLCFIDFEYFGWDDPVKLTADILLHPGTPVDAGLLAEFRRQACSIYGEDNGFAVRLDAFYPLFGLRWALILLNEFHPERWRRRLLAGADEDWAVAKARQMRLARNMLSRLGI